MTSTDIFIALGAVTLFAGILAVMLFLVVMVITPRSKPKRKKMPSLCAYHSSQTKTKGPWLLDGRNCGVCKKEPKGAA